jgi:hypothetical protein
MTWDRTRPRVQAFKIEFLDANDVHARTRAVSRIHFANSEYFFSICSVVVGPETINSR